MKKLILVFVSVLFTAFSFNAKAQLEIVSGLEGGTYFHLANDILKVTSIPINIYTSQGSVDNFKQLMADNNINVTFLQYDVLVTQGILNSQIRDKVRILLPLFIDEEIHLITLKDSKIKRLRDLRLMRVGIGMPSQGTNVTARSIKERLGMVWTDVEIHSNESYEALLDGKIDAFFYVGGAPVDALQAFGAVASERIRMVPITDKRLRGTYQPRTIEKNTYSWASRKVKTMVVPTLLVVNIDKLNPETSAVVEQLYRDITDNVRKLQSEGHPKWRDVYYQNADINWPYHYIPARSSSGSRM